MTCLRNIMPLLAVVAALCVAQAAVGQSGMYQNRDLSARPPLSPWFGLYQKNGGPLDNYHTFVRPRLELNSTVDRQTRDIQRNEAAVQNLDRDVTQIQDGGVRPTGTGSVFMSYLHFYPMRGSGDRAAAGGGTTWRARPPQSASTQRAMSAVGRR